MMRAGTLAFMTGCGSEPAMDSRVRTVHEDGGMPRVDSSFSPDRPVSNSITSLSLTIFATKLGRIGCGRLFVENFRYVENSEGVAFTAEGRWDSFPATGTFSSEVRDRSSNTHSSRYTNEYPEHGVLGLRYFVTGSYNPTTDRLRLSLRNMVADNRAPSTIFMAAVYTGDSNCRPVDGTRLGFQNEFFVAVPAREVEISSSTRRADLCQPCPSPIEQVSLETR